MSEHDKASETPIDYKILWERDSAALGKCLGTLSNCRAVKEDQRAKIIGLERELNALRASPSAMSAREAALKAAEICASFPTLIVPFMRDEIANRIRAFADTLEEKCLLKCGSCGAHHWPDEACAP